MDVPPVRLPNLSQQGLPQVEELVFLEVLSFIGIIRVEVIRRFPICM